MFIVKDFGKALLKTKSSLIFFSYKLSERKPLFEIAHCERDRCGQINRVKHVVKSSFVSHESGVNRDAKFPGILRVVNFHREYWEFCGNIGNFGECWETLGILKYFCCEN